MVKYKIFLLTTAIIIAIGFYKINIIPTHVESTILNPENISTFDRSSYENIKIGEKRIEKKIEGLFQFQEVVVSLPIISFQINTVIGQPNHKETMLNQIVPGRGFHLGGVHIDNLNRIYVVDSGNNRILGFNAYPNENQNADLVIGQPSLSERGSANEDNTHYTQASNSALAILPYPNVISTLESPRALQLATDTDNNLYVPDPENNRVLKFNAPFISDSGADDIWGQPDFTSRQPYCGQSPGFIPNNQTFCLGGSGTGLPDTMALPLIYATAVTVDPAGNLWVADTGNNRILRFPKTGDAIAKNADLVLGQNDFNSRISPNGFTKSLGKMQKPVALKIKPSTGELYVLEGEWGGQARVLVFTPPFTNGMSATREFGRAFFQDNQPADTTNWDDIENKWVHLTTGLYWPRGIAFDPTNPANLFVLDGGNQRAVLFGSNDTIVDVIGQPDADTRGCTGKPEQGYRQTDGTLANLCQADGEIGIDGSGNLYISNIADSDQKNIVRFSTPLVKDDTGHVISNGQLLHKGKNKFSGKTFNNGYGMSRSFGVNPQLYVSDGQRLLVWNNISALTTYAPADFVVGQDTFTENFTNNGGIFSAVYINGQTTDPAGSLYVASDRRIFIFSTPITAGGKDYPVQKILSAYTQNVFWDDDNSPVWFHPAGLAYDAVYDALFVSDPERNRILRIRDPKGDAKVDLVLGQPDKNSESSNAGSSNPTRNGLWTPTYLSFDNFGNLYVVDASYELSGNRRVLRFNASTIVPSGNIFPLPNADAVFSKSSFTTREVESSQPGSPTAIGFNQANQMLLVADGYGNNQFERVYVYDTPHLGEIISPDGVIGLPVAQGGSIIFDDSDRLIMQDHTWNRIVVADINVTAPATPTPTPAQLIKNPGFEIDINGDNKPDSWTSNNKFSKSTSSVRSGAFSGRHSSNSNASYNISQTMSNITAGTSYTFSAWTNIPATSDSFSYRLQLIWKNASGNTLRTDTIKSYTSQTGGWNRVVSTKIAPADTRSVIIRMIVKSLNATIYTDDFSLIKL